MNSTGYPLTKEDYEKSH